MKPNKSDIFKIISLICAIIITVTAFTGCRRSDKNTHVDDFTRPKRSITDTTVFEDLDFKYCVLSDGTAIITDYTGKEKSVKIPDVLGGKTVTSVGDYALAGLDITEVTIGDSVEEIGRYAFMNSSIEKFTFGKNICSVGINAFEETPWFNSLDEEFTIIGDGLLIRYGGKSKSVKIPDNVRHIGPAFNLSESLTSVEIGDSVLSIDEYAFNYCQSLVYVNIGKNVKYIGQYAFNTCISLKALKIPDSVEEIDEYAFFTCTGLLNINLGRGVKTVGDYAFSDCREAKFIFVPKSLESVGEYAFEYCGALKYTLYEGTEEEFSAIKIDSSNYPLLDAERLYNYSGGRNS